MADTILLLKELEDVFYNLTCLVLGIDITDPANEGKVRIAWPTNGAPTWKITEDVAFLRVTPQDDKLTRHQDIIFTGNDPLWAAQETGYTRVHKIDWTLYGPNSYDRSDLIRYNIFSQKYTTKLKENNLFLITDVPMPTRLPELYNGQWWERTDFSATFNELVVRRTEIPYILSPNYKIIENK
ncbi:phage neck terminator protein [Clostridium estertheticum]|uniref:phage neck terminator protein n=1 Tax=Clostridium estertheticum TaxID=238834 RepID=UPI001C7D91E1|nr:hypothetical protein [Clostridium estertheticum]MBX4266540.1 hypothetical protein [Clostridium estertheticum]WLC88120.1 hypothetical protein KTC95_19195 [Clostridium estertheticum]